MNNPTTYKFVYENIADATQVDSSIEGMDLDTEYTVKTLVLMNEYQLFATPYDIEKSRDKSAEFTTKCEEGEYKDEEVVMETRNSQHRGGYRNYTENQIEDLIYYRYEKQLSAVSAARKVGTIKIPFQAMCQTKA